MLNDLIDQEDSMCPSLLPNTFHAESRDATVRLEMIDAEKLRYCVENETSGDNSIANAVLRIYLPEDVTFSDVELTLLTDGSEVSVLIHLSCGHCLGTVNLTGYTLEKSACAKWSIRKQHFSLRLQRSNDSYRTVADSASENGLDTGFQPISRPAVRTQAMLLLQQEQQEARKQLQVNHHNELQQLAKRELQLAEEKEAARRRVEMESQLRAERATQVQKEREREQREREREVEQQREDKREKEEALRQQRVTDERLQQEHLKLLREKEQQRQQTEQNLKLKREAEAQQQEELALLQQKAAALKVQRAHELQLLELRKQAQNRLDTANAEKQQHSTAPSQEGSGSSAAAIAVSPKDETPEDDPELVGLSKGQRKRVLEKRKKASAAGAEGLTEAGDVWLPATSAKQGVAPAHDAGDVKQGPKLAKQAAAAMSSQPLSEDPSESTASNTSGDSQAGAESSAKQMGSSSDGRSGGRAGEQDSSPASSENPSASAARAMEEIASSANKSGSKSGKSKKIIPPSPMAATTAPVAAVAVTDPISPPEGKAKKGSAAAAAAAAQVAPSKRFTLDLETEFGKDALGKIVLGKADDAVLPQRPFCGPFMRTGFHKSSIKSEDRWLQSPHNTWSLEDSSGCTAFSAFGVYDGHGGKDTVNYVANKLMPAVAGFLERANPEAGPQHSNQEAKTTAAVGADCVAEANDEDRSTWAAQEAMLERLPKSLHAGFVEVNKHCVDKFPSSGTTATLAVLVGWELIVASVGDSLAFVDTGSEVIAVSSNHRVADSPDEVARVIAAGGSIGPSEDDAGKGSTQRVWPGGLAMTRSIGDREADRGAGVIAEPEVRQLSLPIAGARLIIASDGLWDATTNAKALIIQLRGMSAGEAASTAACRALRKKGVNDDITVIVVDLVPDETHRNPFAPRPTHGPGVAAAAPHPASKGLDSLNAWKPLENHSETWRERLAHHREAAQQRVADEAAMAAALVAHAAAMEAQKAAAAAEAAAARTAATAQGSSRDAAGAVGSGLYSELINLQIDMSTLLEPDIKPDQDNSEWTTVGNSNPAHTSTNNSTHNAEQASSTKFDYQAELRKAGRPEVITDDRHSETANVSLTMVDSNGGGNIGGGGIRERVREGEVQHHQQQQQQQQRPPRAERDQRDRQPLTRGAGESYQERQPGRGGGGGGGGESQGARGRGGRREERFGGDGGGGRGMGSRDARQDNSGPRGPAPTQPSQQQQTEKPQQQQQPSVSEHGAGGDERPRRQERSGEQQQRPRDGNAGGRGRGDRQDDRRAPRGSARDSGLNPSSEQVGGESAAGHTENRSAYGQGRTISVPASVLQGNKGAPRSVPPAQHSTDPSLRTEGGPADARAVISPPAPQQQQTVAGAASVPPPQQQQQQHFKKADGAPQSGGAGRQQGFEERRGGRGTGERVSGQRENGANMYSQDVLAGERRGDGGGRGMGGHGGGDGGRGGGASRRNGDGYGGADRGPGGSGRQGAPGGANTAGAGDAHAPNQQQQQQQGSRNGPSQLQKQQEESQQGSVQKQGKNVGPATQQHQQQQPLQQSGQQQQQPRRQQQQPRQPQQVASNAPPSAPAVPQAMEGAPPRSRSQQQANMAPVAFGDFGAGFRCE